MLRLMWSGRWGVLTPTSLVLAVWRFMPHFRGYQQQDAMEFFQTLSDCLNEELKVRWHTTVPHRRVVSLTRECACVLVVVVHNADGRRYVVQCPGVWARQARRILCAPSVRYL